MHPSLYAEATIPGSIAHAAAIVAGSAAGRKANGTRGGGVLVPAGFAEAKDLEPVARDREVRSRPKLLEERRDGALVKLDDGPAVGADQVVPMLAVALGTHVGMTAVRPMQPIEDATVHQDIEGAEDGRPANRVAVAGQPANKLVGGERAILLLDRLDNRPARCRDPVSGLL